ncbi:MAG: DUF3368 domain-containing protein [Halofilum sp. (in: g-proteobacteria)]|nr:DUF3368 domain-containing protein [Halofilum sp. (in: g-proteobacteria)]
MPILVSDANIFIDLEIGGVVREAFRLPEEIQTPDFLFQDELAEEHPDLISLGLVLGELDESGIADLVALAGRYTGISRYDSAALALARSIGCPLVTGDSRLRAAARTEAIEVHGTVWLIERMLDEHLITTGTARTAFESMRNNGRRLPWQKAERMIRRKSGS